MKKFYAVIHAHDAAHGINNARAALDSGAYGVALIDQYCSADVVEKIAGELRKGDHRCRLADSVLVNVLRDNAKTLTIAMNYRCGAWVDSFEHDSEFLFNVVFSGLTVLAGCGFKYQNESDLQTGWKLRQVVHVNSYTGPLVPMISGRGTGLAPTDRWVDSIRRLIGPAAPLAIASGITEENIGRFLPHASHFLVGTSIETTDHEIVPERVRALAELVSGAA